MTTLREPASAPARSLAGRSVLQVVPSLRDDRLGRAALDIAVGLLRSGARAFVVGGGGRLVGELQAFGGEWTELDMDGISPLRRAAAMRKLSAVIQSEEVDIVHSHGAAAARVAAAALRQSPALLMTSYIGMPPRRGWRRSREEVQAQGRRVIACSDFAAGLIAERHRAPQERITVIPRAVETGWFDPDAVDPQQVSHLREAWRVGPDTRIVLLPGRLQESQGHLTLVDAARILVNGGLRGVTFVIAANQPAEAGYGARVGERIEAQGVGPVFRQVGHCAHMPAAYAAADLVVLPIERASTFSSVAVEAQSMERPVIASDLGAMPELVQAPEYGHDARTGWLVPPRDPLSLARVVAEVVAMAPQDFDAVARRARQWAHATFAPDRVTAATLATYLHMLSRQHDA